MPSTRSAPRLLLCALLAAGSPVAGGQSFDPTDPLPGGIAAGDVDVDVVEIVDGFVAPNWGTAAPGDAARLYVVDQPGQVVAVDLSSGDTVSFLDVRDRLVALNSYDERGLLGLAFHPDYPRNGRLYTYTSEPVDGAADFSTLPGASNHQSVIAEWRVPAPGDAAARPDPAVRRVLLRIDQPQSNHNAGGLAMDEQGLLYIALGDGGNGNDAGAGHGPGGNGRDAMTVLGAILRIDPLGSNSANGEYGIPADNPLIGDPSALDEIFAYGFRNPFRLSVDRSTGDVWTGDVGQNAIEEVDRVVPGGNHGWNFKEGSFFFDRGRVSIDDPGVPAGLIDPVAEYDHDEGISVIGGFVYRGGELPALRGRYVFGDYGTFGGAGGRLFYLDADGAIRELVPGGLPQAILGFGEDARGELYVMANSTGGPNGRTGVVLALKAADTGGGGGVAGGGNAPGNGGGGGAIGLAFLLILGAARRRYPEHPGD